MKIKKSIFCCILLSINIIAFAAPNSLTQRPEVNKFIEEMVSKHKYDKNTLTSYFSTIESSEDVINKITKPYEALSWGKYKAYLVSSKRIDAGVKFWHKHKEQLHKAEKKFGVPAEIITAILGIESYYGRYKGKHLVLQALATLAFDYPPRSKFFRQELEEFLLLSKEQGFDPLSIKGSYAGAMGSAQFIASSYRNYAIDFANIGSNSLDNIENSIGSVANYFEIHGWEENQPVVHQTHAKTNEYKSLIAKDLRNPKPTLSLSKLKKVGVELPKSLESRVKLSLLELEDESKTELWLGTKNFYVITRYNKSTNYAMAVYQLSQAIKQEMHKKA